MLSQLWTSHQMGRIAINFISFHPSFGRKPQHPGNTWLLPKGHLGNMPIISHDAPRPLSLLIMPKCETVWCNKDATSNTIAFIHFVYFICRHMDRNVGYVENPRNLSAYSAFTEDRPHISEWIVHPRFQARLSWKNKRGCLWQFWFAAFTSF